MKFLNQGEQRCLNAREEATNAHVDIEDLEVLQTPERYLKICTRIYYNYKTL